MQEDTDELEHIINTELGKYDKERIRVTNEITRDVTEVAWNECIRNRSKRRGKSLRGRTFISEGFVYAGMWKYEDLRIELVSTRGSIAGGGGGVRLLQWL